MLTASPRITNLIAALAVATGTASSHARAQEPLTADHLTRMTSEELLDLYRAAPAAAIPPGKVAGRALVRPGSRLAPVLSKVAGLVWQGKIFGDDATVVNRFFGIRVIRTRVSYGPSWLDGAPALVLDYQETSRIYARYRDEIRQVAPGLYLGLMYDRSTPCPRIKTFFALEARR